MPSRLTHIEHVFAGGWAPDYGPIAHVGVDETGKCEIPWLDLASNCEFWYDGSIRKIGGADRLFTTPLEASLYPIRGLTDFWRQGTSGSPTQTRVLHCATRIYMDAGDGNFSSIFTGLQTDSIPDYAPNEGSLIIAQTGIDMPKITDQTTHSELSSSTPNFAFSVAHKLRHWAAGVDAAPDTLFYSAQEDPTDWVGTGSGDIAISPGDGDRITGLASFNNELFVFKGPNIGSIHRITGSAPTGDDAFARKDFIPRGLGAVAHRTIFRFGNDLGFMWSDGSVHSINTTERFGDFLETSLSRPLNGYLRSRITGSVVGSSNAAVENSRGVARIVIPVDSYQYPNLVLSMDFRFNPPRWSSSYELGEVSRCLAMVRDSSTNLRPRMMSGGPNGMVYKLDSPTKILDKPLGVLTEIDMFVRTPYISYLKAPHMSTLYNIGTRIAPKVSGDVTIYWVRDGHDEQSYTFNQWTGDVLATATGGATNFTLGTSRLSGDRSITRSLDATEGGEFQQIQYKVESTGAYNDLHLQSILTSIKPGAIITEDVA